MVRLIVSLLLLLLLRYCRTSLAYLFSLQRALIWGGSPALVQGLGSGKYKKRFEAKCDKFGTKNLNLRAGTARADCER